MDITAHSVLKELLPTDCPFIITKFNKLDEGFQSQIRLALADPDLAHAWRSKLQQKMKAFATFSRSRLRHGRFGQREYMYCRHGYPKVKPQAIYKSRQTGCKAGLMISVKTTTNTRNRYRDPYMPKWPCLVDIKWTHNHPLGPDAKIGYRDLTEEVKQWIITFSHEGHTPGSINALLKTENYTPIFRYYQKFFEEKYEKFSGTLQTDTICPSIQTEFENSESDIQSRILEDESLVVAVVTPLMTRVHQHCPQSGQLVFVDSCGPVEKCNMHVYYMVTSSSVGGLPLGCFLSSSGSQRSLEEGLRLVAAMLPAKAFYGRGKRGPQLFMTEHSGMEKEALRAVYPEACQHLCVYHVLKATWRCLWFRSTGVTWQHRPQILGLMKELLLSSSSEDSLNTKWESVSQDAVLCEYEMIKKYFMTYWTIRDQWALCYLEEAILNGMNTMNVLEKSLHTLRDNILRRHTMLNPVQFVGSVHQFCQHFSQVLAEKTRHPGVVSSDDSTQRVVTFPGTIVPVGEDTFMVKGKASTDRHWVNNLLGLCTCPTGITGTSCKHKLAVRKVVDTCGWKPVPVLSEPERLELYRIAAGEDDGTTVSNDLTSSLHISDASSPEDDSEPFITEQPEDVPASSSTKVTDRVKLSSTKVTAGAKRPSTKVTGGVEPPSTKVTAGAKPPSRKVTVGAKRPSTKVTGGVEPPTTKVTGGVEVPSTKVTGGVKLPSTKVTDRVKLPSTKVTNGVKLPSTKVTDGAKLSSNGVKDGVKLTITKVSDGFKLTSSKVTDGVKLTITKVTGVVKVGSTNVTDGVELTITKVLDGVELSSKKASTNVTDGAVVTSPKVMDGVEVTSPKVTDGVEQASTKVNDGFEVTSTKVMDGVEVTPTKVTDGVKCISTKVMKWSKITSTKITDGVEVTPIKVMGGVQVTSTNVMDGVEVNPSKVMDRVVTHTKVIDGVEIIPTKVMDGVEVNPSEVIPKKAMDGVEVTPIKVMGGVEVNPTKVMGGVEVNPTKVMGGVEVNPTKVMGGVEVNPTKVMGGVEANPTKVMDWVITPTVVMDGVEVIPKKVMDGVEVNPSKVMDGVEVNPSKVMDGVEVIPKKVMDGVEVNPSKVMDGVEVIPKKVMDGVEVIPTKVMGWVEVNPSKVMDGVEVTSTKIMDVVEVNPTKIMDGVEVIPTKVMDGVEVNPSKVMDGVEVTSTDVTDGVKLTISEVTDGVELAKQALTNWCERLGQALATDPDLPSAVIQFTERGDDLLSSGAAALTRALSNFGSEAPPRVIHRLQFDDTTQRPVIGLLRDFLLYPKRPRPS